MRIEFDNCLKNEGPVSDLREFEINAFGKPPQIITKNLNRIEINNTKFDAAVKFKLCLNSGAKNGGAKSVEGAVVADAEFYIAEIQTMPN